MKFHHTFWEWLTWQDEAGPCDLDKCSWLVSFAWYLID